MKATILSNFHCTYEYPFEAIRTFISQDYGEMAIIMFDDGSPVDDVWKPKFDKMVARSKAPVTLLQNEERQGQASARLEMAKAYLAQDPDPDDFVIFFDGDDKMVGRDCISKLAKAFEDDNVDFVFGRMIGWPMPQYDDSVNKENVREKPWACPHPRAIRARVLMDAVLEPEMFKHGGEWIMSATDQALWFELFEQSDVTRKNIDYVEADMWYRIHAGSNLGSEAQQQKALSNEKLVRSRNLDFYTGGE